MNFKIKVFIKDDLGLGDAFMKEGRSQAWVDEAKQIIQWQFEKAAKRIFCPCLGKVYPSCCEFWG